MKIGKKLFLTEDAHATAPFKVKKIVNTIKFKVGQRLTREEVQKILDEWDLWTVEITAGNK